MRSWLYQLLLYASLPFWLLYSHRRCRQTARPAQCWQSLWGLRYPEQARQGVWIHAVSLGEAQVALHLMRRLRQDHPQLPLLFTAGNHSALSVIEQANLPLTTAQYLPLDYAWIRRAFIQRVQPSLLILIETELWPNLLLTAHRYALPIAMIQARVSRRSQQQYPRYAQPLLKQLLSPIKLLAAQTQADRQFFIDMGANPDHSHCLGNLKYDLDMNIAELTHQAAQLAPKLGNRWLWCAGSTHPNEEIPIIAAHQLIQQHYPQALLLLAPRHLRHLETVYERLEQQGIAYMRWSTWLAQDAPVPAEVDVLVMDQLGRLRLGYALSQVCFVGGSLVAWGGHNMLEPAALNKPIITGQHYHNFAEIAQTLIAANAITVVDSDTSLAAQVMAWAETPQKAIQVADAAHQVFLSQQGSTERILSALAPWIPVRWQGNPT